MVCVYCSAPTYVTNSRLQRRINHIWRRRKCTSCASLFTTTEHADLATSFMVDCAGDLQPFSRDRLFISLYESCKHRPTSVGDATALTQVIISQLLKLQKGGTLQRTDIVQTAQLALKRFDLAAATAYAAYHPANKT